MAFDETSEQQSQENRPIEFRSTSEEVAVGTVYGNVIGGMAALVVGGFVGALGARVGRSFGYPSLVGSAVIWLTFWVLPLAGLMRIRPVMRFLVTVLAGAGFLALLQWRIGQRDIGQFYPWILSALPFGIVLGTFFEPIRLASDGGTETYTGRRSEWFLTIGFVLSLIADIFAAGQKRLGATISGFLGGGLSALAFSAVVASRGNVTVAELFFGSVWNIAWAATALGALTGAISGQIAGSIRERQELFHKERLYLASKAESTQSNARSKTQNNRNS